MHSAIIIVSLQLVDKVDNCNYHYCIMGPFSFVPCPEGPKTAIFPLYTGPYKKSKDYTTLIMESMYYPGNYATIFTSCNPTIIMAECIF